MMTFHCKKGEMENYNEAEATRTALKGRDVLLCERVKVSSGMKLDAFWEPIYMSMQMWYALLCYAMGSVSLISKDGNTPQHH